MISALIERFRFARFTNVHRGSRATIEKWQSAQLQRLVPYAVRHVPLWRKRFAEAGIDPLQIKNVHDLTRVPLSNKETYTDVLIEEYIDSSRRFRPQWRETSGRTGKPFKTLTATPFSQLSLYEDFATLRFLWWRGEPFSQLTQLRSKILIDRVSRLLTIAREAKSHVAFAVSYGEVLTEKARNEIETALQCEVYDQYSLGEFGVVGTECAKHDGYHVNSEAFLVEIIAGKIIVTDLLNFNMPFIRYDTGDHGRISFERCECGLYGPRIWLAGN
jgi:phenylacetate-coenzyme A ligase PaaK-like adenylate-forming protein